MAGPIFKIYSEKHQREILLDVQHVESENERLRNQVRELNKTIYHMSCYKNGLEVRLQQYKNECNELAGDYYRTLNRLINEKKNIKNKIHDLVFDYKEEIPDGVYLKLMQTLM